MRSFLLMLALVACESTEGPPTWETHVAPILEAQCVSCHAAGGLAPNRLDTYEAAASQASLIAFMTRTRMMPPWTADQSGACGDFADRAWLSDDQIDTLERWAAAGTPGPEKSATLIAPSAALSVSRTVMMPEPYTPHDGEVDDHRCFALGTLDTTTFITAFRVLPGDARIVHHAVLFSVPGTSTRYLHDLDDADPGPGYGCLAGGSEIPGAAPVAAWAPGQDVTRLPAGTGVKVEGTDQLVLQIHYNTTNGPGPDQSRVELELAAIVDHEAVFLALDDEAMMLDPGLAAATTSVTRVPRDVGVTEPLTLYGIYPHMHLRGTSTRVTLTHDGDEQCLLDLPRWDFHWQRFWFFERPFTIMPDDMLRLTCTFDTRGETAPLTWGFSTDDEMCIAGFYAVRGDTFH